MRVTIRILGVSVSFTPGRVVVLALLTYGLSRVNLASLLEILKKLGG